MTIQVHAQAGRGGNGGGNGSGFVVVCIDLGLSPRSKRGLVVVEMVVVMCWWCRLHRSRIICVDPHEVVGGRRC